MEDNKRSIAKALSWRITGTIDTVLVALIVTGEIGPALQIGTIELATKMILYYFHERVWNKIAWGIDPMTYEEDNRRSAAKALSWRLTGTVDTFIIAYIITGGLSAAVGIGVLEWVSKMLLYYFHERAWNKIAWGKVKAKL